MSQRPWKFLSPMFCPVLLLAAVAAGAEELAPEAVVESYLKAYQTRDFRSAYPLITKAMARDLDQAAWVEEQERLVKMAEAQILRFKVYPAKIDGETALVPNVLVSKDKLFNQTGATEHELYSLVREEGSWKIDHQRLVMASDLGKWFPEEAIPAAP